MFIFSPVQIIKKNEIVIPEYTRASLALHNGLQLHLSLFDTDDDEGVLSEIFCSPIPLNQRFDLWIMKASFNDRPGLLEELTNLLKGMKIDIVQCNGITSEHNKYCHVEFVLDNRLYESDFDMDTKFRSTNEDLTLKGLEAKISSAFIEDILFARSNKPLITIYRNIPLYRSTSRLLDREIVSVADGVIKIPNEIMNNIIEGHKNAYPNINKLNGIKALPLATVVSEPENALFRVLIFFRNTGHLHVRIKANNLVGTLSAITKRLNDAKFNIFQVYTRNIDSSNGHSYTDLLVWLPSDHDKYQSDERLKKFVCGIFEDTYLEDFNFNVIFPDFLAS